MKRLLVGLTIGYIALLVLGCWYAGLVRRPVERCGRDPQEEREREILLRGVDDAVLNGRALSRELQRIMDDRYPVLTAAGMQ